MASNAQKTPFGRSQNAFAAKKAAEAIAATGRELPCSIVSVAGWIVTVKFEVQGPLTLPNLTVPVASSLYDYLPLQVGDPGAVRAADARLGGLSELGSGTATYPATVGNLAALVFEPFGKKSWTPYSDPKVRVVQGPNGVLIQDLESNSTILLLKDSIVATRGNSSLSLTDDTAFLASNGNDVTVDSDGIHINGTLYINDKEYLDHEHTGVQTGGGNTGGVIDP